MNNEQMITETGQIKKQLNVLLSPELIEGLRIQRVKQGRPVNHIMEDALTDFFAKDVVPVMNESSDPHALTMSSLELLAIINQARKEWAEPIIQNSKFLTRVEDELADEVYGQKKILTVPEGGGTPMASYLLNIDQCMLVAMRESKGVRRNVLAALKARQAPAIPQTLPDALRLAADLAEKNEALSFERDEAIRTKAEIGSRREATAMATAAAAKRENYMLKEQLGYNANHATVITVEKALKRKFPKNAYVGLRKWCKANGVAPKDVTDPRYGQVKAWPAAAWMEVYGVDLVALNGGIV